MKVRANRTVGSVSCEIECDYNAFDKQEIAEADRFISAVVSVPKKPDYKKPEETVSAEEMGVENAG